MLAIILVSSASIVLDSPRRDPASALVAHLKMVDDVCVALFTLELAVKAIAMGFICGPTAYLKSR